MDGIDMIKNKPAHEKLLKVNGLNSMKFKNIIGDYGLIIVFATVFVYLAFQSQHFLKISNIINIVRQSSIIGFIALGMTFVIITAGIDLSVGSVLGLTGVVSASLALGDGSILIPIIVGLAVGVFVGLVNSLLIVYGKILPFLATLAAMTGIRSLALIYSNGHPISGLNSSFTWLGTGMIGPIPIPVLIFVIFAILLDHILVRTQFGRHVKAVGGSIDTAKKVGIHAKSILIKVYILNGFMAAIGGIVLTARVNGADPLAGDQYELRAIAAAVIGGASITGGEGSIRGTVLGVMLVGMLMNGLDLLNVSSYYQNAIQGMVLVLAVLLNRWKSE